MLWNNLTASYAGGAAVRLVFTDPEITETYNIERIHAVH
jgi:hypothetical protein